MATGAGVQRVRFRRLVQRALDSIPPQLAERIDNVEIFVRSRPTADELDAAGLQRGQMLLGLYQGHPLTSRASHYDNALPDRITLYQDAIEAVCATEDDVVEQVRRTVLHEIAHFFGIDDDRLHEIDAY